MFKVGDKVKIIVDGADFDEGYIGLITDFDGEQYEVNGVPWFDEDELELVTTRLAVLLGVDDGVPFQVIDDSADFCGEYTVTDGALIDIDGDVADVPGGIFDGSQRVVPVDGEWYSGKTLYFVDSCGEVDSIAYDRYDDLCVALILLGNAFTTEEAAQNVAEKINADIVKELGEC